MSGDRSQYAAFVAWLEQHGGYVHPSLDLFTQLPSGDRGVVAMQAIKQGDQLLIVPRSLCMHISKATVADAAALRVIQEMKLSPFLSMVLYMLAERALGDKSRFAPYLNLLPATHDCLMSWTDDERAELVGTDLEDRAQGESAAEVYARQVEPRLKQHPDIWPPSVCGAEAFQWCAGMVQSRAFHLVKENFLTHVQLEGTDLYMLTGIDMINHSSFPACRSSTLQLVTQPLTVRVGEPQRELTLDAYFSMKAERDIAAGEQVLHTYGDLSDAQLCMTYGFVEEPLAAAAAAAAGTPAAEPDAAAAAARLQEDGQQQHELEAEQENPNNAAFIPADMLADSCRMLAAVAGMADVADEGAQHERRELLAGLGVLQNVAVVPASGPLTEELLTAAQVLLMPAEDWAEYKKEFDTAAAARAPTSTEPAAGVLGRACLDDEDFREGVCMALLRAAQAALKRYPTTLEEDEALLQQADVPWRRRCAVRVRLGEKRLLHRLKAELLVLLGAGGDEDDSGGSSEDPDTEDNEDLGSRDSERSGGSEDGSEGEEAGEDDEGGPDVAEQAEPAPKRHRK